MRTPMLTDIDLLNMDQSIIRLTRIDTDLPREEAHDPYGVVVRLRIVSAPSNENYQE